MSKSIKHIENLIRVVSNIPDDRFDLRYWFDSRRGCGCAIGHALHDSYFVKEGLAIVIGPNSMKEIGLFFDIGENRARQLFVGRPEHRSRQDMLIALRVLLLEKMAQKMNLVAIDIKDDWKIRPMSEAQVACLVD